jgi:hypothetical protein
MTFHAFLGIAGTQIMSSCGELEDQTGAIAGQVTFENKHPVLFSTALA